MDDIAAPAADAAPDATESDPMAMLRRLARGFVPDLSDRAARRALTARVSAPARLHFGFLDLNFSLGRRFVGLGMAVDAPATVLSLARAPEGTLTAEGPESGRARDHLARLVRDHGARSGFRLTVERAIPPHAGLGSGTQLALAVAAAYAALEAPAAEAAHLARELGRAERSAIGFAAFRAGGVVLDGGRGPDTEVPPIISRLPFPDDWRVLLVFDGARVGVHGEAERAAFATLPPFPEAASAALCRLVLVRALPALAEADFPAFAAVVGEIQARVGDHFAPAQGGGRFASADVADVLAWLAKEGHAGLGQTSWGPTGFCLLPDAAAAERLAETARGRYAHRPQLSFAVVRGRNTGARITVR
jgi:beta-ribofuranosylaminobenzene 5'-phosphate synthase